jgi:hypothetical protein
MIVRENRTLFEWIRDRCRIIEIGGMLPMADKINFQLTYG